MPHRFTYYNAIAIGILASLVILLFIFSLHKDRHSRSQESLIYLYDNYPTDDYIIVVGVYTGLYFQGGTRSKVGIKLIGERHSSRVHVLSTPGRHTLSNGQDDWFVITLSRPLGKLTSVHLWQDHHDLSGWYCKRVVAYDIHENRQYVANVDKWLVVNVNDDIPRFEIARALSFNVMNDGVNNQTPHSFITNYAREVRNTHHELSFFLMHERYLCTYEVKCYILLTKVLSICIWIWFFQDVAYKWTHGKYLDPGSTRRMVGLSKELFVWAFLAALLSHPLTFLLDCLCRFSHLSKILQRRTTNPLQYGPGIHTVSSISRRSTSRVRASAGNIMRKYSRTSPVKHHHNVAGEWKKYLHLAFGPCQFRCADIDRNTITTIRMRIVTRLVRLVSCILIATLFSSIVYIEFYTEFRWKSGTSAVVVALALFLDAFLLSPFLILVKTSITFFIFEMDNKEKFVLSEEIRVHHPVRVYYLDYLFKATGKEYKPLLTPEIEGLRRKKLIRVFAMKALFHFVALVAMCICITLLADKYSKEHFHMMQTLRVSLKDMGDSGYEIPGRPINKVFDIPSAADYVSSTIAGFTGVWPNDEQIMGSLRAPNVRWSHDHFGQGIGSTCVLLLILGNEEHHVVPLEFKEYFDDARGSYSTSTAKTDPIVLGNKVMNYTVISNSWIYGMTKTAYPFAGQLRVIPLNPWEEYYSQMRILMDDFMTQEDGDCRALIVSTNYIYPFAMYLVTVDVIIEFRSSGIGVPRIQVRGIKTGAPSHATMTVLRWMIVGIMLFFTIYTIAGICRVGFKGYLSVPFNIIKCLIVLITGAAVFGQVLRIPLMYGAIQRFARTPDNEYSDLHSIYIYELADSFCLLFVFLVLLIDSMLIIPRLLGSEWFKRFCLSCIRPALLVYLLQQYTILMITEVAQMFDYSYGQLLIMIHTHQIQPNVVHSGRVDQATMFNFSVVVLTIMSNGLTAIIICIALATKGRTDIPLSRYVAILKTKPPRSETTTPPMRRMTETQPSSRTNTSTARTSRRHASIASVFKRNTSVSSSHREQRNTRQRLSALAQLSDKVGSKQTLLY